MAKMQTLVQFITTLSKAEKRFFKLYASLQEGAKDYLVLFKLLEQKLPALAVKTHFKKKRPAGSFATAQKHLYRVLTDCMLHLRRNQHPSTIIINDLLKVNLLFERSLYDEGFRQLSRIQAKATALELYPLELWAAQLELYYSCNLNFHSLAEADLIKKQMKARETLRRYEAVLQHVSIYEVLRYRLVHKGHVRTAEERKELTDLVITELNLVANAQAETITRSKTHLLFQAHYFLMINDYDSALQTFRELHSLLEQHLFLWHESPIDYLSTLEGLLTSLHSAGAYDKMPYFYEKLKELSHPSLYFQVLTNRLLYIFQVRTLQDFGLFEKAVALGMEYDETLFARIGILDHDKQAELYLYRALAYFGQNDLNKAHAFLSKVLLQPQHYHSLPVYQTFRMVHLLVHYELGNHNIIEHEVRSIKRKLAMKKKDGFLLEHLVLTFMRLHPGALEKRRDRSLLKWNAILESIRFDRNEKQVLRIFDFTTWMKAKMEGKAFDILMRQKHPAVQHPPDVQ